MRTSQRKGTAVSPRGARPNPSFFSQDDEFSESDHVSGDLTSAQQDLAQAKRALEAARSEFASVQDVFNDREARISELVASLSASSGSTPEHAQLLQRIAELTFDIEDTESRLTEARKYSNAASITQLEKEKANYFSCIANLNQKIRETEKRIRKQQFELFDIFVSEQWHETTAMAAEHQITMRVKENLERASRNAADEAKSTQPKRGDFSPQIQALLDKRAELTRQCHEAQQQRTAMQFRRRVTIACILEDLRRLNAALIALGEPGIDVERHRRQFLPEGPLSPLKRPKSSNASVRGSKSDYLTGVSTGRSKSDIKRPIRGGRGCLSPLGGR